MIPQQPVLFQESPEIAGGNNLANVVLA